MILTFDLKKHFGAFSFEVDYSAKGSRTGVFGPSGSGKSTLVNLLSGLEHPERGFISLDGETLFDSSRHINIPPEHRRIGIVFQHPHLFPHLSVKRNLLYGFKRSDPDDRKITLDGIVEVLQLGHLLKRGIHFLSGGEKQRVALGRAVLSNPKLLLMDEPLSALDDKLKFQIIPFLIKTCEMFKIPYIYISHSLLEMRIMTDNVLTINAGKVNMKITAEELSLDGMKDASGYKNILKLRDPRRINGLTAYRWGERELFISSPGEMPEALFELSSTDIILFKRHPEAISARNLIRCQVVKIFEAGRRIGVELECGKERLIAEVVKEAADELGIKTGKDIYAGIKAVAFRRLY